MDLLLPLFDFPTTEIQNWINVQMSYSRQKFTSFLMTKIASWPSKDSNSGTRNKMNQKTYYYLLNGLLSLFNFPKLDYFANILMTKILFGGLKKTPIQVSEVKSNQIHITYQMDPYLIFLAEIKNWSMCKWAVQHIISQILCLQAIYSQFWLVVQNMKIRWIYLFW